MQLFCNINGGEVDLYVEEVGGVIIIGLLWKTFFLCDEIIGA